MPTDVTNIDPSAVSELSKRINAPDTTKTVTADSRASERTPVATRKQDTMMDAIKRASNDDLDVVFIAVIEALNTRGYNFGEPHRILRDLEREEPVRKSQTFSAEYMGDSGDEDVKA